MQLKHFQDLISKEYVKMQSKNMKAEKGLQLMKLHLLYVKHLFHKIPGCLLFPGQLLYHAATDM